MNERPSPLVGVQIAIIGGCGHVGLPLGVKLALAGASTTLIDIDETAVASVNAGRFPFLEHGGDAQLAQVVGRTLRATSDANACHAVDAVIFVVGTPVDEHLNPWLSGLFKVFDDFLARVSQNSLVIMRSTLFPGTMKHLLERTRRSGKTVRLAFCPERVAEGHALDEIDGLPQIVAAFDQESFEAAYRLFAAIAPAVIRLSVEEAEMAKLMTNSWRYLEFAIANQFYMIAQASGLDFHRLYQAIRYDYPRAASFKAPGFAAGPCLLKDTMQLGSHYKHQFTLGNSAMFINEGLAVCVVDGATARLGGELWGRTVGLLGMTFKADSDDTRESLSFRVKKGLEFKGARVLYNDPYLAGSVPIEELDTISDLLILCTPHREYRDLHLVKPCLDVWGIFDPVTLEILPGTRTPVGRTSP